MNRGGRRKKSSEYAVVLSHSNYENAAVEEDPYTKPEGV